MNCELQDKIFSINEQGFEALALDIFRFQCTANQLYGSFVKTLGVNPEEVGAVADIPFMPISFFKGHEVVSGSFIAETMFESSGTTQTGNSRHFVKSLALYRESFRKAFELFYGSPREWCIIGLLPAYLERQHSSLVVMVDELIKQSGHPNSGFYLYDHKALMEVIARNERTGQKTLLIGVTFALLDLAEKFKMPFKNVTVMETGGMKGRRKELTREEVHTALKNAWGLSSIHSEYGMTELLSQAYSAGEGLYHCPTWMRIILREEDDPLSVKIAHSKKIINGLINVIDLANIYSCSFIATDDIGKLHSNGAFEVIGRMDSSDVRGCSLMYTG